MKAQLDPPFFLTEAPQAEKLNAAASFQTMSQGLWGQWNSNTCKSFQLKDEKTISVTLAPWLRMFNILKVSLEEMNQDHVPPSLLQQDSRKKFYSKYADCFLFSGDGQDLAAVIAHPLDWENYYLRFVYVHESARGLGLFSLYLKQLTQDLQRVNASSIQIETSPANAAQIQALNKNGFVITGQSVSQWGLLIRFTKFLNERNAQGFKEQFSKGFSSNLKKGDQ